MREKLIRLAFVLPLAATVAVAAPATTGAAGQSDESFRETFEAIAVCMGTSTPPVIPPGANARVQINITRWTTETERGVLLKQMKENGQAGLLAALRQQESSGWLSDRSRTPSARATMGTVTGSGARSAAGAPGSRVRPRQEILYAWQRDLGEGRRRIVAALDRPVSLADALERPSWRDHDLTLLVMDVGSDGEGEG